MAAQQPFAPMLREVHLAPAIPFEGTPATLTPAALTATVARVFPFTIQGNLTLNRVIVKSPAAQTTGFQFGIFDDLGVRSWSSGAASLTANYTTLTAAGAPLGPGTYLFAVTNNNSASATAALQVCAPLMAASMPGYGTVPATNGAMPATIDPATITKTVGGWPIYVTLSEWT